jgi:hypothetical protein
MRLGANAFRAAPNGLSPDPDELSEERATRAPGIRRYNLLIIETVAGVRQDRDWGLFPYVRKRPNPGPGSRGRVGARSDATGGTNQLPDVGLGDWRSRPTAVSLYSGVPTAESRYGPVTLFRNTVVVWNVAKACPGATLQVRRTGNTAPP